MSIRIYTVKQVAQELNIKPNEVTVLTKYYLKKQKVGGGWWLFNEDIQKLKELIASSPQETQTE